ncbi:MAG TPA: acetamidase/formamidase family protein [Thermoleophilaceae bacterium]|nr:acetamidase/formamidase family protein [Thermoleophilaceae bacterium]
MTIRIEIDRSQPLHEGAANGHNRWHPELEAVATVDPGDVVTFEIRDSRDRSLTRDSVHEDLLDTANIAHPLTGPLEVRGAEPGDLLELELLGYETDSFGWTAIWPGSGFLGDLFDRPFLVRWELADGLARSQEVPGVAIPASVHAGTIGVAPSRELFERALAREQTLAERGGRTHPPNPEDAWPPAARDGLRTYPPRENGGNMDIRDLGAGARLWIPVHVPGALLSVGDLHFAQGDGEVCISAIETGGSATMRVGLRRDGWRPTFPCYEAPPRPPRAMFATTGIPLADDGSQGDLDLNLATRRALIELLSWLQHERGLSREAAYVLMSVAAELRVSQLVDIPNPLVSAALPLEIFEEGAARQA